MDSAFTHPLEILCAMPTPPEQPYLVLHAVDQCNASCSHCVVEGGPRRKGELAPETAREAIADASAAGMRLVVFSGGESFLRLRTLLELCTFARHRAIKTRVVTNGYWARSPDRACSMLEHVADHGIDELVVSFDSFHLPYIPKERVLNIYRGVQQARRSPHLVFSTVIPQRRRAQMLQESQSPFPLPKGVVDELTAYGFPLERCVPHRIALAQLSLMECDGERARFKSVMTHERVLVSWEVLALGGRAAREARHLVILKRTPQSPEPCRIAGLQVTVDSGGAVYPCCSTWTNHPQHRCGTVNGPGQFAHVLKRMATDPLVSFIHDFGPGELVKFLRARGIDLPERHGGICDMCESMLSGITSADLHAAVEAYHHERLWSVAVHDLEALPCAPVNVAHQNPVDFNSN